MSFVSAVDLAAKDELKTFKDEGEEDKSQSENLISSIIRPNSLPMYLDHHHHSSWAKLYSGHITSPFPPPAHFNFYSSPLYSHTLPTSSFQLMWNLQRFRPSLQFHPHHPHSHTHPHPQHPHPTSHLASPYTSPYASHPSPNPSLTSSLPPTPLPSNYHHHDNTDNDNSSQSCEGELDVSNFDSSSKLCHVKKPLNAFMLFMKEHRAEVVSESSLKESAAINQILGKKWHELEKEGQAPYYAKANAEREIHLQRYPGWTAKDNYAVNQKKKKKREKMENEERNAHKKCRATFGLDNQIKWCNPCRRKKKCIKFLDEQ